MPHPLPPNIADAMTQFTEFMLPFSSHLTAPRILDLFDRYVSSPSTLAPDQLSLILICIAMGYLRLQGFTPGGTVDSGQQAGRAIPVPDDERMDVAFFRNSVNVLEKWGSVSFTSLRRSDHHGVDADLGRRSLRNLVLFVSHLHERYNADYCFVADCASEGARHPPGTDAGAWLLLHRPCRPHVSAGPLCALVSLREVEMSWSPC